MRMAITQTLQIFLGATDRVNGAAFATAAEFLSCYDAEDHDI